jgi:hypothetical protein
MWAAVATLVLIGGSVAYACDQNKDAKAASASSSACTAAAAAKCTAAQAAACKAHSVSATAVAASAEGGCVHGSAATAASAEGCAKGAAKAASAGYSCDHGASASAANAAGCAHGASATADGECPYHGAGVVMTSYSGMHGAGANGSCTRGGKHGAAAAAFAVASHTDCDACGDLAACEKALEDAGASTQIVPLKNGVMYVYTADTPSRIRAVQSALSRRNERMIRFASSGDKVHLCPECKDMRGTAASGKLSREIVNIEGGCLTVMTSSDPTVVARLYSMAGIHVGARTKS